MLVNFSYSTQKAAGPPLHFCLTELTWRAGVTAVFDLLDAAGRTHRPSKAAGWAAPHPCAWCPASRRSPKVSQLHAAPATFPAQDTHSAHASRLKRNENLYMEATVFNLTEEGEAIPHKPTNPPRQMARICSPCAGCSLSRSAEHVVTSCWERIFHLHMHR